MRQVFALLALLSLLPAASAWAVDVDDASDICAANADPCLVTQAYDIKNGVTLDFGTRTVRVQVGGQLDTNDGQATILAGNFAVDPGSLVGLKVKGVNDFGVTDGGTLTLQARRRCQLDTNRTCLANSNCNFGSCSAHVCAGNPNRGCASDTGCNLGTCSANKTCTGDALYACAVDADCQLGSCSIDVCSGSRSTQCSTNGDCNFGTCSIGTGDVQLLSPTRADSGNLGGVPGSVLIRAAGNITVGASINANSGSLDVDGGLIELESDNGTVTVDALLSATGGATATGGEIDLSALEDVVVNDVVDVSGGDLDGGLLQIDATRDVVIGEALRANSRIGGGFGGEIDVTAGRDVVMNSPAVIGVDGHTSSDNLGGWGGTVDVSAVNDIVLNAGVAMTATGSAPDGFGGEIAFDAGGDLAIAGSVSADTANTATLGVGGDIDISVQGAFNFPTGALIDIHGAQGGSGALYVVTGGPMTFGGTLDGRTANNGPADGITLDIGADVTMTGSILVSGKANGRLNGQVSFEFCRLTMKSGALIQNVGAYGKNTLHARERVTIQSGASMTADATTGANRIIYRDAAKPPVVAGTVSPAAPANDINPNLPGCPVCGNNELDGGETCEDGNTDNGDGCNSDCQDEACVAQTPGFPTVPICDDGQGCTKDVCTAHNCTHIDSCDDGVACTVDTCIEVQNECKHEPNDALCDDGNPCTNDTCLGERACVSTNNAATCDDGISCTADDVCTLGVCVGNDTCPDGQACNLESNQCEVSGFCGDGTVDGLEECDDGDAIFIQGESCDASCLLVDCGDPDNTGTVRASDALFVLRAAVGSSTCDLCVCNVDGSTSAGITASDALRVLRAAVGSSAVFACPAC